MSLTLALLLKTLPLYAYVVLGYIAGRWLNVERHSISAIVFYMLFPMIIFTGILRMEITAEALVFPGIVFLLAFANCQIFYRLGRKVWADGRANVLGMGAGLGNMGYFGLPVAMVLFDAQTVGVYILGILGGALFENSYGYYLSARGRYSPKDALLKLFQLPSLYAFLAGLALNLIGLRLPVWADDFLVQSRGAYSYLGMFVIGVGLASVQTMKIGWRFVSLALVAKFIGWPLLAYIFITLDMYFFHLYPTNIHQALFVIATVPMAANSVVIASLLNVHPEKVALAVALSTVLAVVYVPWVIGWFIG